MRQLVGRLDGRRALRSLKTLVSLRADFCAARHLAFLLAPAHIKEFVRNPEPRRKLDRVEPLVGIGEQNPCLKWLGWLKKSLPDAKSI